MDLFNVMSQVGTAVDTITGLRVKAWDAQTGSAPMALVTLPAEIDYHGTYGAGLQVITDLGVLVLLGKASDRVALKRACEYVHPTGAKSVKKAIETYPSYTALDDITVTSAEFEREATLDGTEYLGVLFHCTVHGPAT